MTLLVIVLVVLGVVAVGAVWRRFAGGGSRADEHAITRHEHALGVLGDTARRADPPPSVRVVLPAETARVHIKPSEEGASPVPRPTGEDVPPPRVRLEPPVVPGLPLDARLAFGTPVQGTPAVRPYGEPAGWEVERPAGDRPEKRELEPSLLAAADEPAHAAPRPQRTRTRRAPAGNGGLTMGQRRAAAAILVLLLVGATVAAVELTGGHTPARADATSTTVHRQRGNGTSHGSSTTTSTVAPTTSTIASIVPVTSSATEVSYRAPATSYTLTFDATGPCWVGIQQSAGGPWVWEETIQSGAQATYSASGGVVVRLGAPTQIKVAVDGITVQLPSNVQPYDLTFSPSA